MHLFDIVLLFGVALFPKHPQNTPNYLICGAGIKLLSGPSRRINFCILSLSNCFSTSLVVMSMASADEKLFAYSSNRLKKLAKSSFLFSPSFLRRR